MQILVMKLRWTGSEMRGTLFATLAQVLTTHVLNTTFEVHILPALEV